MTLIGNFTCSCASFMQSYTISSCFQLCDKHVIPIIVTHNKITNRIFISYGYLI